MCYEFHGLQDVETN